MPCCSVTQSQEVGQGATVRRKTITRPNLRVAVLNMFSDDATRLPDSMTHLFRVIDSEICCSIANNY